MKATTSVQTVAIQTEELDEEARRKANVYDKVDNTKRCELIRMVCLRFQTRSVSVCVTPN